jgi:PAS domain S-box-containing protein
MPKRTNILVVDDDAARRKALSAKLRGAGHRVTTATTGQEAAALFGKKPFNIVLANVKLPDVSGRQILETTKEFNPEVAVIMMANNANLEAAVDAVSEGAYAYILKPEATDELKTLINNALREQELSIRNRKLVESLQQSNRLFSEANEKLQNEISERKQAEELLRQNEEKYRMLFELSPIGITTVDMKGTITSCNPAVYQKGGYSAGEQVGKHFSKVAVVRPKDMPKFLRVFNSIARGKVPQPFEVAYNRKDGSLGWTELHIALLAAGGKKLGIQVMQRDVTDRKHMEQEIQRKNEQLEAQNEELEKASRAKSDFLARMSHELRTPLNVVMGFAELMLDQVPGEINEEQRQCLDDILTSSRHLLGLINEVLDLTKVESGKVELKLKNIALSEVVESVTSAMTAVISQRKQSLDVRLDGGLPLLKVDEDRLRQVFFNLLSNASKFTPDRGKLKIEASRKDGWCQVSVSDNGIGIKEEDLKQIFEPFYQAEDSMTRESRGTGLGLTLVKEIVEMHGGQILVKSKYGKGSSFIFTLPLVAAEVTGVKEDTDSGR